jgi:hypothetical protein
MIATEATVTEMPDDNSNLPDDPFDIQDTAMDIDDVVMGGAPAPDALETNVDPDASNWQTELVRQAKEKNLPSELVSQIEGISDVGDILSIISSVVKKDAPAGPDPEPKSNVSSSEDQEFDIGIDESSAFDPDAVRAMRAMNNHYSKRLRDLESRLAEKNDRESMDTASNFVKTLGTEWRQVFGSDEKPNVQNIKKLEDSMQTIRAGYAARHKRLPGEQEILNMALNTAFGDKNNEIARNKINDKVAKRASQMVARPGTRTTPAANPRMRAAQGVADWFRSKGIDPFSAEGDEFK